MVQGVAEAVARRRGRRRQQPAVEDWPSIDPLKGVLMVPPVCLQRGHVARRTCAEVAEWGMKGSEEAPPVGVRRQQGRPRWDNSDGGNGGSGQPLGRQHAKVVVWRQWRWGR